MSKEKRIAKIHWFLEKKPLDAELLTCTKPSVTLLQYTIFCSILFSSSHFDIELVVKCISKKNLIGELENQSNEQNSAKLFETVTNLGV